MDIFKTLCLLLIGLGIVFFLHAAYSARQKLPTEKEKKVILEEYCGGRFNFYNLTTPFVRHALYEDCIIIRYGKKSIILNYKDITRATLQSHLFSKGITYTHKNKNAPKRVIIWSRSPAMVLKILNQMGVNVEQI